MLQRIAPVACLWDQLCHYTVLFVLIRLDRSPHKSSLSGFFSALYTCACVCVQLPNYVYGQRYVQYPCNPWPNQRAQSPALMWIKRGQADAHLFQGVIMSAVQYRLFGSEKVFMSCIRGVQTWFELDDGQFATPTSGWNMAGYNGHHVMYRDVESNLHNPHIHLSPIWALSAVDYDEGCTIVIGLTVFIQSALVHEMQYWKCMTTVSRPRLPTNISGPVWTAYWIQKGGNNHWMYDERCQSQSLWKQLKYRSAEMNMLTSRKHRLNCLRCTLLLEMCDHIVVVQPRPCPRSIWSIREFRKSGLSLHKRLYYL